MRLTPAAAIVGTWRDYGIKEAHTSTLVFCFNLQWAKDL